MLKTKREEVQTCLLSHLHTAGQSQRRVWRARPIIGYRIVIDNWCSSSVMQHAVSLNQTEAPWFCLWGQFVLVCLTLLCCTIELFFLERQKFFTVGLSIQSRLKYLHLLNRLALLISRHWLLMSLLVLRYDTDMDIPLRLKWNNIFEIGK